MMKLRLLSLVAVLAMVSMMVLAPYSPVEAKSQGSVTQAVTGTIAGGGTFSGAYTITKFVSKNNQLFAVGTLSGTLTDWLGNVIGTVTNVPVTIPVIGASGW